MLGILMLILPCAFAQNFPSLGTYNVDTNAISVSGLSSGGGFTSSFFVSYSSALAGAGYFAGMPYGCTRVLLCDDVQDMVDYARQNDALDEIDGVENIMDKPVYIFHGGEDWMVPVVQGEKIESFFELLGANVASNMSNICGHGTPHYKNGIECDNTWLPGINNCAWMGAYHTLDHIYGGMTDPGQDTALDGEWIEFDQTEFFNDEINQDHSFDEAGYAYIPSQCVDGSTVCKLHVHFHGCFIVRWLQGDDYAKFNGFPETGEANNVIILQPQLAPEVEAGNLGGCWDSYGYSGDDFDTRTGIQQRLVWKMINRLTG